MARVLIVEDSAAVRMALVEVVAALGHDVVDAADGRDAIAKLQTDDIFDLVITDVLMPEADGVEVIKALRALDRNTRVLAVSGGAPGLPAGFALRMTEMFNADAILYKPFLDEELEAVIGRLLGADDGVGGRAAER